MVPCTFDQMEITHIHHKEDVMHPKELHGFSSQLEIHIVLPYYAVVYLQSYRPY